jgi:hypothetical protein
MLVYCKVSVFGGKRKGKQWIALIAALPEKLTAVPNVVILVIETTV